MSKYTIAMVAALGASNVAAFSATIEGCYSSTTGLTLNSTDTFNSAGYCSTQCLALEMPVMATKDSTCYCGPTLPPASTSTDNSSCTTQCPGYPSDKCAFTPFHPHTLSLLIIFRWWYWTLQRLAHRFDIRCHECRRFSIGYVIGCNS